MRRRWIALLAVALVACQTQPGAQPGTSGTKTSGPRPTGAVGEMLTQAANLATSTAVTDARFQIFLEALDLNKEFGARAAEITAAISETRTNATKAKKAAAAGPRLASVRAVFGELTVEYLATKLSASLDPFTKGSGTVTATPSHTTETKSTDTAITITSLDITETISSQGDRVQIAMKWNYRTVVQDLKAGTVLLDLTDVRDAVAAIKVCPDEQGQVFGSVDVSSKFSGTTPQKKIDLTAKSGSVFTGHVNDSAGLDSVSQTFQDKESWVTSSGSRDFDTTMTMSFGANGSGGFMDGRDEGSAQGNLHVSDASDAELAARAIKALGWAMTLDAQSLERSYQEAQRLWRNGRCVIVFVPEYRAETPIEVADQNKPQHDEPVDISSDTKFKGDLKHRFQGIVRAKINASLSGDKKLEPDVIETPPGQLTYKAPDEQSKEATVTLKSTSRRGIGTLVIKFHTEGQALTLKLSGTNTIGPQIQQLVANLSVGPATFKKGDGDVWTASGPFSATSRLVPPDKDCPGLTVTESGTAEFTAKVEKRGEQKFWVVHSELGGNTKVQAGGCDASADYASGLFGGFMTGLFIAAIGDITIPYDGGTVPVSGANAGGGRASGSAVGTIEKK
jgi:hypothetical protein